MNKLPQITLAFWVMIGSAIALVVVARYWTRIPGVVLFWVAFVLTRPFGATWATSSPSHMKRAAWTSAQSVRRPCWAGCCWCSC